MLADKVPQLQCTYLVFSVIMLSCSDTQQHQDDPALGLFHQSLRLCEIVAQLRHIFFGLELQEKNGHIKKPKASIDNICVSILLERDILRSNASVFGYKKHGYTQRGSSATLPCYGSCCRKSNQISGS